MESDQEHINSVERQPQHPLASCFRACYSWQLHSSAYVKILSRAHSIFSEMWHDNIPKGKGFGGEHPSIFTCWTPRGKTFCVMSIFFPSSNRTGRLGERQHCCVSSSFLPPPHSTILLTAVQATWQGANAPVIAFLKGNNVKDKQSL